MNQPIPDDRRPRPSWTIAVLTSRDARLQQVVALWGANRKTLGLFPEGAFEDCIAQGRLVVALTGEGTVAGYLTFRVQRRLNSAAIIHLCTGPVARGKGCSDLERLVAWHEKHVN